MRWMSTYFYLVNVTDISTPVKPKISNAGFHTKSILLGRWVQPRLLTIKLSDFSGQALFTRVRSEQNKSIAVKSWLELHNPYFQTSTV